MALRETNAGNTRHSNQTLEHRASGRSRGRARSSRSQVWAAKRGGSRFTTVGKFPGRTWLTAPRLPHSAIGDISPIAARCCLSSQSQHRRTSRASSDQRHDGCTLTHSCPDDDGPSDAHCGYATTLASSSVHAGLGHHAADIPTDVGLSGELPQLACSSRTIAGGHGRARAREPELLDPRSDDAGDRLRQLEWRGCGSADDGRHLAHRLQSRWWSALYGFRQWTGQWQHEQCEWES